jgi:subtilisin family serine protease
VHGSNPLRQNGTFGQRAKADKRRPAGVSRRRKRSYAFETLEDRRVMSAESPAPVLQQHLANLTSWQISSFSSNSLDGQLAILQQELARYSDTPATAYRQTTRSVPNDPLLAHQWHLINSGQQVGNPDFQNIFGVAGEDINVAPVWNRGYTGQGVTVAVIDSGVQMDHPDLAANIHPTLRFDAILADGDPSPEPDFFDPNFEVIRILNNAHGTAVAGLIGAVANNGIGGAGVAPGVSLVPIRLIDVGQSAQRTVDSFQFATLNNIDITNNSWGPADTRTLGAPTAAEWTAIRDSIFFGRDLDGPGGNDALGTIHIWASGNGGGIGTLDYSNYDQYASSRYVINVTGVDHDGFYNNIDGTVTSYPEIGTAVLVAAPTGSNAAIDIINDTGLGSGLVTTDVTDSPVPNGFNVDPNPNNGQETDRDFLDDTDYTTRFNGTSGAAPVAAGVVALMLEANPNLSWRDVQEILVRSARQNAPFGQSADGADKAFNISHANTWIVNQWPLFHDPDPWDPTRNPTLQTQYPLLDPNLTWTASTFHGGIFPGGQNHYAPAPAQVTNGAGYTVSMGQGTNREWIGYGHGVIDADMAVTLAEQWHVKNQALPDELTWTTEINTFFDPLVPAAQNTGENNGDYVVPGGLGGEGGFIDYYAEYYDGNPFQADELMGLLDNERSDGYIEIAVPDDGNTMTVESVDVTLSIDNWAAAMNNLRVVLVSPNGTHSELNNFYIDPSFEDDFVQINAVNGILDVVSPTTVVDDQFFFTPASNGGGFVNFTLTTKRHWGERSDAEVYYNPFTGDPVIDTATGFEMVYNPGQTSVVGDVLKKGWQLHFENWGTTDINVNAIEISFHGRPIAAASERVMGFVGIDESQDDQFNFSRVIRDAASELLFDTDQNLNYGGLPGELRLGDVVTMVDPNQEAFASNITVTARRVSDGSIAATFVTGADGNYYFDLVPDDYIISIDDPLGRLAKDDSLTPDQHLRHYKSEWLITEEWFRAWDHDDLNLLPTEVLVQPDGTPIPFLDTNGAETVAGMRNINFLLDIGPDIPASAEFSGTVYADTNGDGVFNGVDVNLPNVVIFGDVNRNGIRDGGEATTTTDANGNYTLVVPVVQAGVVNIGVVRPTNWTATNDLPGTGDSRTDGIETFFVRQGDSLGNIVFSLQPPADNIGGGGVNQSGILLGFVYEDANDSKTRQANEPGVAGMTVFIDANNNGVVDAGDTSTTTNAHGAYVFTNVAPGQHRIRVITPSPLVPTTPSPGQPRQVTLTGSSTISNIQFGIKNSAPFDYGDLPAIYGATLLSENGARHKKGAYWLGAAIDTELDGHPSPNADGDDLFLPQMDEDGITFGTIVPGQTATLVANASRNGGVLQAWVDWNNDGDFNDVGERILSDYAINQGDNTVTFNVPAGANVAQVYARFRYGEHSIAASSIETPFGEANLGEVEDYQLDVAIPVSQTASLPADADSDGDVDGNDFLLWQRNVGMATGATRSHGNANGDGQVNGSDLLWWKGSFGDTLADVAQAVVTAPADGDFDDGGEQASAATLGSFSAAGAASAVAKSGLGGAATSTAPASGDVTPEHVDNAAFVDLASRLGGGPTLTVRSFGANGEGRPAARGGYQSAGEPQADAFVQRDRAFDDLFGTRRRQGLLAAAGGELAGDDVDCDDVFAALADHFERPLG